MTSLCVRVISCLGVLFLLCVFGHHDVGQVAFDFVVSMKRGKNSLMEHATSTLLLCLLYMFT